MPQKTVLMAIMLLPLITSELQHAQAETNFKQQAEKLATLRSRIEQLSHAIQEKRSSHKQRMHSLAVQEEELQLMIQREQVRVQSLKKIRQNKLAELKKQNQSWHELKTPIMKACEQIETNIGQSLPFKREERMQAVREIKSSLAQQIISSQTALARLWQMVEDELRLSKESGLYQQVIQLGSKRKLVDIAKIGMQVLYYRSIQDEYGYTVHSKNTGYRFQPITKPKQIEGVKKLFSSLMQQVRQGVFALPLQLSIDVEE